MKIPTTTLKESFEEYSKRPKMNSPDDVGSFCINKILPDRECFIVLCLNTKNGVLEAHTTSIGSLNANVVHPREVFKTALLASSAHIIVVHNHPSGDPTPSREDIEITKKLVESGKMLGIDLLDHVIIGNGSGKTFSMKESGHI